MESIVDRLIQELETFKLEPAFSDIMEVSSEVHWDDPGLVMVDEYPYFYVEPVNEQPKIETAGRAGYYTMVHTINVGLVINQSDFFDPSVSESAGSRPLVQAMSLLRKRFRRLSKSQLDGLVRRLAVASIQYTPDVRDDTFVRLAVMTLSVERQYQHEE